MPALVEDAWINEQAVKHAVAEIEDCAIAVDATYYLQQWLDHDEPLLEPLVPALGGLTSLQNRIEEDLNQWHAHRATPFFIFNGQTISGQDDISTDRGLRANIETNQAWDQYFSGDPERAVQSFGLNPGAFPIQDLYPLLQGVLRQRKLHFLVPPYNAAAQIAYFEMIDSDQCAGIMGSQELLLYPIKDSSGKLERERGCTASTHARDLVRATFAQEKGKPKALESSDAIISVSIWRFLHLRGYVDDSHQLTAWGSALAAALTAMEATTKKYPMVPHLYESVLLAFEMIRFDLLNTRNKHTELGGYPMNGSEEDQASLLLIIRCATLLRLRHREIGYTGPLSKNLLAFRSLVCEVRTADRDLIEAVIASMFMFAQANRHRDDSWELSHRLPFLFVPDVGLAIAVKTWLDDIAPSVSAQEREGKKESFHQDYVPFATHLWEDVEICYQLFDALYAGVKTLHGKTMSSSDRAEWGKAAKFLETRR
ncbi:hypothetical protein P8C59_000320 [Phyllachora maydis]|uniref:Post-transcriptional regulator MKT1 C-terminal domain-containing protein n=1 Tax=Phyllachora maydis TaxID=1825666 RepID=A0AAD9HVS1_9PEZI|nr:hypothetical protein P8C59_000320 [Phyllachora maydis]